MQLRMFSGFFGGVAVSLMGLSAHSASGGASAVSASSTAASTACSASAGAVGIYKDAYESTVNQYNMAIGMLKAAPITSSKKLCSSAGNALHKALPALEDAVEKLEKLLFKKSGDERKIIDWIILGGNLSEALTDLQPRIEKLLPLLKFLDDPQNGLRGLAGSLSNLQTAASGATTLSKKLGTCSDWNAAKSAHGRAKVLASTGLESVTKSLEVLGRVQEKTGEIRSALKSAKATFDPARARIKKLVGDNLEETERRTAVLFFPAAPLIYTGEFIQDKLGVGKDRLRQFAGVSEGAWQITHTKSNSDSVAKAVREAIFPKLKDAEDSLDEFILTMNKFEDDLPGIIKSLTDAQTGLETINPTVQGSVVPSVACQQCWFAD